MEGQLRKMTVEVRGVNFLEELSNTPMKPNATRDGKLAVQRVPEQHVRKCVATAVRGGLGDEPSMEGYVQQPEQRLPLGVHQRFEHYQGELSTEDGGEAQHPIAFRRQPVQTAPDHLAHALRDERMCPLDDVGCEPPVRDEES